MSLVRLRASSVRGIDRSLQQSGSRSHPKSSPASSAKRTYAFNTNSIDDSSSLNANSLNASSSEKDLLAPHYKRLAVTFKDSVDKDLFPLFKTFLPLPAVKAIWVPDEAMDDKLWLGGIDAVALQAELAEYRAKIKIPFFLHVVEAIKKARTPLPAPLLTRLNPPPPVDPSSSPPPPLTDADMDPYFFPRTSQFRCYACATFHAFPAICGHLRSHNKSLEPGPYSAAVSEELVVASSKLFGKLGIAPSKTMDAELEAMGAGIACRGCRKKKSVWIECEGGKRKRKGRKVAVAGLKWSELVRPSFRFLRTRSSLTVRRPS